MSRLATLGLVVKVCVFHGGRSSVHIAGLQPAPPVGFNLTFMCPEGEVAAPGSPSFTQHCQVFDHDWFATPFAMLTCQVIVTSEIAAEYVH